MANRILGLLLAALAMETIIDASADLFHEAGNQIQEMSFLRR